MKVVIFCGGAGTRLREETAFKPKPLVTIGGMPIIWHIMKMYDHYGHNEFILPLGYKGYMIKDYFVNFSWRANDFSLNLKTKDIKVHKNHINEDWNIHFVDTGLNSKTALRLHKIKKLLKDDEMFMVTYGDGISNINIDELIAYHKKKGKMVTLSGIKIGSKFGIIDVDDDGSATGFKEKPKEAGIINGGFMVFDKKVLKYIDGEDTMLVESLLPFLAEEGELAVFPHEGFWYSMDTYRDYLKLNEMWDNNKRSWVVWKENGEKI